MKTDVIGARRMPAKVVPMPTSTYAPMTSVFMIVEVSGNYSIILPVMISNTIAYFVSRQFQHAALFDLLARQDGTDLPSMEEERETEMRAVEDAMRDPSAVILRGDESIDRSVARASLTASQHFLIPLDAGRWGAVSRWELEAHQSQGRGGEPTSLATLPIPPPYLYPDQSMDFALQLLRRHPVVPVVHRADPTRLVGLLSLDDLVRLQPRA